MNMWVVDYLFHMELSQTTVFQKDIEAEFSINRATASKMLTLMEKKKLIKRTNYASDSRLKQIELEPYGLELQKMCYHIREEIERELTAFLTEEEVKIFKTIYLRILANM